MDKQRKNNSSPSYGIWALFLVFLILLTSLFIMKSLLQGKKTIILPEKPGKTLPLSNKYIAPEGGMKTSPEIAVVIDDVGWNQDILPLVKKMSYPLTFAIIPDTPYAEDLAKAFSKMPNCQMIMHVPLEPVSSSAMKGGEFITIGMSDAEVREKFDGFYEPLGKYIIGVNNHMGSKFTVDKEKMDVLLDDIKSKNLFFLDSLTSPKSIGYTEARNIGLKTAKRDIFLDNVISREEIINKMETVKKIAAENGEAVAIGHAHELTLQTLQDILPRLSKEGFKVVFLSQVVR